MSIKFPNKLKEIGDGAFEKCESLETVIIPNNVNTIENNAFAECCNLKSVTLPNNITKINSGLFMNTSLKRIYIPSSVTFIGLNVFNRCNSFTTIYGTADSYAELYAKSYGYTFIAQEN